MGSKNAEKNKTVCCPLFVVRSACNVLVSHTTLHTCRRRSKIRYTIINTPVAKCKHPFYFPIFIFVFVECFFMDRQYLGFLCELDFWCKRFFKINVIISLWRITGLPSLATLTHFRSNLKMLDGKSSSFPPFPSFFLFLSNCKIRLYFLFCECMSSSEVFF